MQSFEDNFKVEKVNKLVCSLSHRTAPHETWNCVYSLAAWRLSWVQYVYPERQLAWQGDREVRDFYRSPTGLTLWKKTQSQTEFLNVMDVIELPWWRPCKASPRMLAHLITAEI